MRSVVVPNESYTDAHYVQWQFDVPDSLNVAVS